MAVSYVKFQRGTQAAYDKLTVRDASNNIIKKPDDNTLYFIYPEGNDSVGRLYLGDRLISGGDVVLTAASLNDLADVITDNAKTNDFLVFNGKNWIAKTIDDVVELIKNTINITAAPANVFQVVKLDTDASDNEAINRAVVAAGKTTEDLSAGDIAIVKCVIVDTNYSHTAYIYDGAAWVAMDGNYNAENVYFNNDFTLAGAYSSVGNIALSDRTLEAKGKSLEQLMQRIFTKELYPALGDNRDLPTITLSGDSNKSGEVGDTFELPEVTVTVSDVGSYAYGPATGIVFKPENLTIAEGAISSATNKKSNTSDFTKGNTLTLIASDAKGTVYADEVISYTFNAEGTYTDGAIPVTNLGNDYQDGQITSDKAIAGARTVKRTGWRNYWYGFISTVDVEGTTIYRVIDSTSENYNKVGDGTKWLIAGGAAVASGTLPTITAVAGDKMPVVLVPSGSKAVISAEMPSSLYASVTFNKAENTIKLHGFNGAVEAEYDLWYYEAAAMPVGASFSIVLG